MKKILMILFAFFMVLSGSSVVAQNLYAVGFAATLDSKIGKSCEIDAAHFDNEFKSLQQHLGGYRVNVKVFSGNDCKASVLYNYLNNLQTTDKDIIVFYYSGHGGRNVTDINDKFPQMDMHNEPPQNYVPVKKVREILSQQPARLRLIIADCCNKEDDRYGSSTMRRCFPKGQTIVSVEQNEKLKKLFLDFKGEVVLSGSQAGQYSYGDNIDGGVCTYEFLLALDAVAKGRISPNWNSVCSETRTRVSSSNHLQVPEYEINVTNDYQQVTPPPPNPYVDDRLSEAFNTLINRTTSVDSRNNLVNSVFNNYFTSGAKILIVGRDLKTPMGYVDAQSYLQQICFSPTIVQINILNFTEQGGKKNYLKVHEVHIKLDDN